MGRTSGWRAAAGIAAVLAAATLLLTAGCVTVSLPLVEPEYEPAPDVPDVFRAEVTRHTDGDTFHVRLDDWSREKVRLIGIDTPEVGERLEPYGEAAAAYTAEAVPIGTTVWLEIDTEQRDKYTRLLAYVWLERPADRSEAEVRAKMLNARIVLDGYAQAFTYPPNVRYNDLLMRLQAEARSAERGLWAAE
jgi:micrococcal nuclease